MEQVPDATGEVALEAADGFLGALAFAAFATRPERKSLHRD